MARVVFSMPVWLGDEYHEDLFEIGPVEFCMHEGSLSCHAFTRIF